MKTKILVLILGLTFSMSEFKAQDWVQMMQDPTVNFYQVQQAFNIYWAKNEKKAAIRKMFGGKESQTADENYEKYKRWEFFTEPRVYPSGDRTLIMKAGKEIQENFISATQRPNATLMAGNWMLLGPTSQTSAGGGAGRLNCVRFDPSNPATIYVGAPSGGLWKSTNNGGSWSTTTDRLAVIGVSDVAVDPTNSNVIYIATGDGDATDSYSNGILKSTDGGATWNATGLTYNVVDTRKAYRILISPANHNIIMAGTSSGLFKSLDAGVTWSKIMNAPIKDLAYKPGDPTVVYAVSTGNFYHSSDSGNTFTMTTTGTPGASSVCRIALAVTAANPNYVYLLAANANTYNFHGLYRSSDAGLTFTVRSTTPNLLGFNSSGNDTGGQGWYTLSLAASPTNAEEIVTGGVNVWHSTTGGSSWNCVSNWTGGFNYCHADIHCLSYLPGSGTTFFAACDGGLFKSVSASWTDLSNGLQIGEMYRLGVAQTNNMVIQGWQDNGTNQYDPTSNPVWNQVYGGDGMDCFIDYSNSNYQYGETYNGGLFATTNNWNTSHNISNGITGTGAWVTPWGIDPVTPATIYAGFQEVWKSTNRGTSWTQISHTGSSTSLTMLAIAHSNPQYIYAGSPGNIMKTTNGGTTWTDLTTGLPGNGTLSHIDISYTNPNVIWITYSGYTPGSKVFKSLDGGLTWTNLSGNLPNIPANCSVNQPGTADGVYVGTDVGVYYRDTTMANWTFFSNGLPNVVIDELEIQYNTKKLAAATYGRGLWETALYDPTSNLPLANFLSDITTGCPGMTVNFTDASTNGATSWNWYFAGGTPSTSTAQNPVITYNNPGTFNLVKLTASNANGSDSVTRYSYIGVSPQPMPIISLLSGKDTVCNGSVVVLSASQGSSYTWSPSGSGSSSISTSISGTFTVTITDSYGCSATSAPKSVSIIPPPTVNIVQHGDTLISNYASGNQWYLGTTPIAGQTGPKYIMFGTGNFTDHVSIGGCTGTSNTIAGISENQALENAMTVFPNPSDGKVTLTCNLEGHSNYVIRISDVTGRLIYTESVMISGNAERNYDLTSYGKGVYFLELEGQKGRAVKKVIVY